MPTPRRRVALLTAAAVALTAVGVATPAPLAAAVAGVDPGRVDLTIAPGGTSTFAASVTTSPVAPNPEIVFLADTTGSMDPALANVRNNLPAIIDEVRAAQPAARFGVAEYKEARDGTRVFRVDAGITDDRKAVVNGAQQWLYNVGGGGQPQTDFINAQFQLANGAVTFRPSGTRVIAWFGDARSNDPSLGHTLTATVNSLRAQGIRVVAVPVTGTNAPGLNELGQATTLTNGTSGVLMPSQSSSAVATAILNGIKTLTVNVTAVPTCDQQLTLTANPAMRTVRSGAAAAFTETVRVKPGTTGGAYDCTVDFQVNGMSVGYTQTVTVHVPGSRPAIRISDVTVDEGDSGRTPATLTVTLNQAATQQVSVGWSTVAGTAGDRDFAAGSGTVTFAPGQTSAQVTVGVTGDAADEPDETFAVHLSNPVNATVEDADGVVTIRDDDEPVLLRISDTSLYEADDNDLPATLTISMDRASAEQVTVDWATVPGTATSDDFQEAHGTLTFAPGETSKQVEVTVFGDTTADDGETFTVHLSNPSGATIADADGVVTINDDEGPPPTDTAAWIGDASVPEGGAGTTPVTLTVTLDEPHTTPMTLTWSLVPGTAVPPDDFVDIGGGYVTFAPGQTSTQITTLVLGDLTPEGDESFTIKLDAPGAIDDTGLVTIVEDDGPRDPHPGVLPPALRIGDVTVPEGDGGSTPATVTVVLDKPYGGELSVTWLTVNGTATDPGDYTRGSGTLTFARGQTSQQITVPIIGDPSEENTETFGILLTNSVTAELLDNFGVVTITNDDDADGASVLTVDDASVVEHAGPAVLNVRLSALRDEPVTVRLATSEGSATEPADFGGVDQTLTFEPGETLVQVPVVIVDDLDAEGEETFTAELSNPSGADAVDPLAVVTVVDDDGDTGDEPAVSVSDAAASEDGGRLVFPVRLTKPAAGEVTVAWTTTPFTANGDDFLAGDGTVRFAAGETEAGIEIPLAEDTLAEGDESFRLTLSAPAGATLGDAEAQGVILDDDDHAVTPSVSVNDTSVRENAGPAGFEVRLSEAAADEVTVEWRTGDGTAAAPGDYASGSGTVVFTPGQRSALVPVPVGDDTLDEGDETFTLTLSDPSGATIGDGTAVGTIVDDDGGTTGGFTCTASSATLLGTRPAVANPGGKPCADDTRSAAALKLGLGLLNVRVDGLTAATDVAPGGISATAGLLTTKISTVGLVIEIGAITSTATATCVAGPAGMAPSFSGSSSIAWLKVNGVPLEIGSGRVTVPLLVGSLTLNSTVADGDGATQRAFDLRTLLGSVVIGESTVGASGNPC